MQYSASVHFCPGSYCSEVVNVFIAHSALNHYNNSLSRDQRWSPRGRPWPRGRSWPRGRPRGHILKSLASKVKSLALASRPQVLEN